MGRKIIIIIKKRKEKKTVVPSVGSTSGLHQGKVVSERKFKKQKRNYF